MNHKRKKPKKSRAGCLMCKPHKVKAWENKHKRRKELEEDVRKEEVE